MSTSTSRPLRFSIRAWAPKLNFAGWPLPLRISFASGSVLDSCVLLLRVSPRKSTMPVPSGPDLGGSPSLRFKLLKEAQDSISVPSTVKCSSESSRCSWACLMMPAKNAWAISCSMSRARFLEKVE